MGKRIRSGSGRSRHPNGPDVVEATGAATIAPVTGTSTATIAVPNGLDADPWAKTLAATKKPFVDEPLAMVEDQLAAIRSDIQVAATTSREQFAAMATRLRLRRNFCAFTVCQLLAPLRREQ